MPETLATSVRFCIVCYFLLLDVHESFKQENIAVPPAAHLFTEVKVLYTSNTVYYVPRKKSWQKRITNTIQTREVSVQHFEM